jgi:NAD(P)-dependent dehydrogenase (short-subunit alcohol dehydrogenase family)
LAPLGITANTIRAGVTDTAALRKIPGWEGIRDKALSQNPAGRLTTPADVAAAIALLVEPGAAWISGNVIGVDGAEDIAS